MRMIDKLHLLWDEEFKASGKEPAGFLIGEDDWPMVYGLIHTENPVLSQMLIDEESHGFMKFGKFPIFFIPGSLYPTVIRKQPIRCVV